MNLPVPTVHVEDEQFLIVEKPVHLHTAPIQATDASNLLAQVINQYPGIATLPGKKNIEPGLLHRLDFETSGLVLIARTETAFVNLNEQFKHNQVTKCYFAVGLFRENQLTGSPREIPLPDWVHICRSWPEASTPSSFVFKSYFKPWGPNRKLVKVISEEEKTKNRADVTPLSYISEINFLKRRRNNYLLQVTLTKGFRHQVRAHLAWLGLPIAGDPLYLRPLADNLQQGKYNRMYLHAAGIKFSHPITGKIINYQTQLPGDFAALFEK